MDRQLVYKIIDSERDYQDWRWDEFDDDHNHPADWIIYMEQHLEKAKKAIYNSHDMKTFTDEIRKVTALGVACMENHGAELREIPEPPKGD